MAAVLDGQTLTLTGFVGDNWFGDGFTYDDVMVALASITDTSELLVVINSGGGYASDGAAIHAMLARRSGITNVLVDGVAASAASLIAMVGDKITMSAGSVMMIHDPANVTFGTSADHQKTIEMLEAQATSYARVYAAKSGKSADECRAIMKAETWMTPDEAIAKHFADATNDNEAHAVAAFDYRVYAHASQELKAVAKANGWTMAKATRKTPTASAPVTPRQKKETPTMTDKTTADGKTANTEAAASTAAYEAVKADRERRAAIMALPEAKGREALAEHLHASTEMTVEQVKSALAAAPAVQTEPQPSQAAYDQSRAAAGAGLAMPGGQEKQPAKTTALSAAVARTNKLR